MERLSELNALLNMDEKGNETIMQMRILAEKEATQTAGMP